MAGNLSKRPNNDAEAGKDGVGISRAYVQDGNLYVVLTDNRTLLAGYVKGPVPQKGVDYLTKEEVNRIKNEIAPIRGVDYWTEEDKEEIVKAASPVRGTHYWTEDDKEKIKEDIDAEHAHGGAPASGILLEEKSISRTVLPEEWALPTAEFAEAVYVINNPELADHPYFKVIWNGKEYQIKNTGNGDVYLSFAEDETNTTISISIYCITDATYRLGINKSNPQGVSADIAYFTLTPATGTYKSTVRQLDKIYIPDYVSKTYVDSLKTHGAEAVYGEKTVFDLSDAWESNEGEYRTNTVEYVPFETGKQYAVNWHGKTYICTAKEEYFAEQDYYVYSINNEEIEYGKEGYFWFAWTPKYNVFDIHYWGHTESCEIMPYSEIVEQLDKKFIPDYVGKTYVDEPFYEDVAYEESTANWDDSNWQFEEGDGVNGFYCLSDFVKFDNENLYFDLKNSLSDICYINYNNKVYEMKISESDSVEDAEFPELSFIAFFLGENGEGYVHIRKDGFAIIENHSNDKPSFTSISVSVGTNTTRKIKADRVPDYISKTEVKEMVGDIDTALDSIIALQNELIGGDAE